MWDVARSGFQSENGLIRERTGNAIGLLTCYGDGSSLEILEPVMTCGNGNLRHRAIRTYLQLTDHHVTGRVQDVFYHHTAHDDLDRRAGYEELIRAYGEAKNQNDSQKAGRILLTLANMVSDEVDRSNFALLDTFLSKESKDYAESDLRTRLQRLRSQLGTHKEGQLYLPHAPEIDAAKRRLIGRIKQTGVGTGERGRRSGPTDGDRAVHPDPPEDLATVPVGHVIGSPASEPVRGEAASPVSAPDLAEKPQPIRDGWTYAAIGLAALALGAAGAWLVLRRQSRSGAND